MMILVMEVIANLGKGDDDTNEWAIATMLKGVSSGEIFPC